MFWSLNSYLISTEELWFSLFPGYFLTVDYSWVLLKKTALYHSLPTFTQLLKKGRKSTVAYKKCSYDEILWKFSLSEDTYLDIIHLTMYAIFRKHLQVFSQFEKSQSKFYIPVVITCFYKETYSVCIDSYKTIAASASSKYLRIAEDLS